MTATVATPDFALPHVGGQPVVVSAVYLRSPSDSDGLEVFVDVLNRSQELVVGFALVIAGESCTSKPGWPTIPYGVLNANRTDDCSELPLPAGQVASFGVPGQFVEQAAAVARRTCGREAPITIAITRVEFSGGSHWELGEAIRNGAVYEYDDP